MNTYDKLHEIKKMCEDLEEFVAAFYNSIIDKDSNGIIHANYELNRKAADLIIAYMVSFKEDLTHEMDNYFKPIIEKEEK